MSRYKFIPMAINAMKKYDRQTVVLSPKSRRSFPLLRKLQTAVVSTYKNPRYVSFLLKSSVGFRGLGFRGLGLSGLGFGGLGFRVVGLRLRAPKPRMPVSAAKIGLPQSQVSLDCCV